MLQELMNELIAMYGDRVHSDTVYCGYGTVIDRIIEESGVSLTLFRKLDALAYARAMNRSL